MSLTIVVATAVRARSASSDRNCSWQLRDDNGSHLLKYKSKLDISRNKCLNTQIFTEPNGATTVLTLPTSLSITGPTTLVTGGSTLTLGLAPTTTTGTDIEVFTEPDGATTTLTLESDYPIIAPTTLVTGDSTLTLYPEPTSSSSTSSGVVPVIQTLQDPDGDLFTVTQPSITGIETISTSGSTLELAPFVTLFTNSPTSTMTTVPPGVTVAAFTEWTASTNGYVTSTVGGTPVVFPVIVPCATCVPDIIEGWDDDLPNVWIKWPKFPHLPSFHIPCIFFCSHPKKNPSPPVNDGPPPSAEGEPSASSTPTSSPSPSSSGSSSSSSASSTSTTSSSASSSGSSSSSSTSSSTSSAPLASTTPDFKGTDPDLVAQVEAYQAPFLGCLSTFVLPFPTACVSSNSTASGSSSASASSTSQPTTFSTSTITSSTASIPSFLPMTYSYADPDQGVSSAYCQYSGLDYPASFTTIGTSVNSCAYTAVPSTTIPPQSLTSSVNSAFCQYSSLDYPESFATIGTSVNPCAYTSLPASTIPAPTAATTTVSSSPSSTAPASATTPTLSTIDPASAAAETALCYSTTDGSSHVPFSLSDANTAIHDLCVRSASLDPTVQASVDFPQYPGDGYTITVAMEWATDQTDCGVPAAFDIPNQQYDCAASFEVNTNCMDDGNVIGGVWVLNTGAGCVGVTMSANPSSDS
ncbi:hypothetical protein M409DRAFT_22878 [Zasmidium cellare ATCC 36951]|uniref:Uncharacterized protein n=1 Tax=Zasmidium cellare ATCC 36951 TaxID=1080233 RepID=A0A6A6CLK5_ZASCE|nr:uncharacterized protein M409DRAFT_22878 [Zasmidium cellare ATCC 36951]KAF2166822.1 hypothetical protein M409DRAFT_22878 [Zasmidium cellare ATCC 36951]